MKTAKELCEEIKNKEALDFKTLVADTINNIFKVLLENQGNVEIFSDARVDMYGICWFLDRNYKLTEEVRARLISLGYTMDNISKEIVESVYVIEYFGPLPYNRKVNRTKIINGYKFSANCDCKEVE